MKINEFISSCPLKLNGWCESERLEWKESTSDLKAVVKTVAAFANTTGGIIVCGVDDSGKVIGQTVEDSTVKLITQSILANTDERLIVNLERLTLEGRSVLVLQVEESPLKPHLAFGKAFKRMGSSNVALSQAEYRAMLAEKQNGHGADRDLLKDCSMADIDTTLLYKFVEIANERRNSNFSTLADPHDILSSLELMHKGVLTKGAILLFGKEPQKIIPATEIRAAFFKDEQKDIFLDQAIITGDLFSQFDQSVAFAKKHILIGSDTGLLGTRSTSQFPIVAIQEMIANALIHRDYHDQASSYLNIVANHSIEVKNPGALPTPQVSSENMHEEHASLPRNRRLSRAFYLAGITEQWGMGGSRIYRACLKAKLNAPVRSSQRGSVAVRVVL